MVLLFIPFYPSYPINVINTTNVGAVAPSIIFSCFFFLRCGWLHPFKNYVSKILAATPSLVCFRFSLFFFFCSCFCLCFLCVCFFFVFFFFRFIPLFRVWFSFCTCFFCPENYRSSKIPPRTSWILIAYWFYLKIRDGKKITLFSLQMLLNFVQSYYECYIFKERLELSALKMFLFCMFFLVLEMLEILCKNIKTRPYFFY